MTVKVQVLRSSTASKRPTSTALLDGELALNTNSGTAGIFFEDALGVVRKVGPAEVGGTAPNASPASGGSAGNSTGEFWYDTANTAGNGQDVLKVYNGSSWHRPGDVTIGSTNIGVGDSATTTIAGLVSLTSTTLDATSGLIVQNQGYVEFREQTGNGTNYVRLIAPDSVTNNTVLKLPDGDGSNENVLITDGSGNLSWAAPAGTTVETQDSGNANSTHYITFVQDNNAAGSPTDELVYTDASLSYNPATNILSINAATVSSSMSTAAFTLNGTLISASGSELNILDGATLDVGELNVLDGITASTAELNYTDGVTSNIQTQLNSKGTLSNQNALINLSGRPAGSADLGSFTGAIISDGEDVKQALQDLETALEAAAGGGALAASVATITDSTNSTHYLTFVGDDNSSSTQEFVKTDAGVSYNPSTNVLSVTGGIVGDLTGNVTGDLVGDVTGNATSSDTVDVTDDNSTNTNYNILFTDGGGSGKTIREDAGIIYNPSTNTLTTTELVGDLTGNVTGNATSADTVDVTDSSSTNSSFNIVFSSGSGAAKQINQDSALSYNPSLNKLTAGTFSGALTGNATSADTVKTASSSTDANFFLTFATNNNASASAEALFTDAGIYYNPANNQFNANGVNTGVLSLNGVDVTSTAAELNLLDGTTIGSAVASKVLAVDANRDIANLNVVTATSFVGPVTGNITGDLTGNADSATQVKTQSSSTNADFFLTFVADNNGSNTNEAVFTDASIKYNPGTDTLTATTVASQYYKIDGQLLSSTAAELNILDGATVTTGELNILDGATLDVAELNILDGATLTTTELNYVDGVTSSIQTQLDSKQANLTGGSGIDITSSTVSVDLATADQTLTLAGYTSAEAFINGTYDIYTSFAGTVSGAAGNVTSMTWAANTSYNVYTAGGNKFIAYNTTDSSWVAIYAPSGIGTPADGGTVSVSMAGYDLPTASNVTKEGKNSPDASSWTEGSYSSGQEPFLAFSGGKLYATALDEDDMSSNSATHLATQQSIKAYVDAIDTDRIIDGDTNVTVDGTADTVVFQTSGVQRWVIGANGNFAPIADSSYDFGVAGSAIRNLVATNVTGTLQTASQTNVTGVGTLTAGTWNATTIAAQYGGTGLNGASASNGELLIGNGSGYTLSTLTEGQSVTITNAGGSITVAADLASAAGTSAVGNAGVASFTTAQFAVDANGFVTHAGGFGLSTITADSGSTTPSGNGITVAGGTGITSTGSGASLTLKLDDTAVTAAAYGAADSVGTFTVDAQGRLTAAADVAINILHTQVSDFDTGVRTNRLDQMATPTTSVAMGSQKITGLSDPTADQDAATKKYVDDTAQGLNTKASVEVATTAALPAFTYSNGAAGNGATITADGNGVVTIDGAALTASERVLVKNEVSGNLPYNGIYTVTTVGTASAALVLTRAVDQDANAEFAGAYVFVESGTVNANSGFVCTAEDPFTVGTTDVTWEQFSGAGQIEAGDGLTKSGNTLNVGGTADRISVSANAVDIATTYVGQTSLTTLGTITTGTWNGSILGLSYGGTGVDNTAVTARHALIGPTSGTGNSTFRALGC